MTLAAEIFRRFVDFVAKGTFDIPKMRVVRIGFYIPGQCCHVLMATMAFDAFLHKNFLLGG
jgi:hypothetical protein